ncbi:MAG: Flp family type IVb pilin [Sphingomonas sp.]
MITLTAIEVQTGVLAVRHWLKYLAKDQSGASAVEYGLIASLIVIAMIASFRQVATVTTGMWNNVSSTVSQAR